VSITSSRWGPHHGPQSALLWGTSAYEIAGDVSYPSEMGKSKHAEKGCTYCHMVELEEHGPYAGGHTFNMTYEYHDEETDAVEACTECHASAEDFDVNGVQTAVLDLHDSLGNMLFDKGWIDEDGYVTASSSKPLKLDPDDAGALLNFRYVLEDGSDGIHNPAYIQALLKNSIQHMSN
jgi:hypothetical protein